MALRLFFSYAHEDESLRDELEKHLAILKHQGIVATWHDRRIRAGQPIHTAIDAQLEQADVILLLVSPDFLASEYCYAKEMRRALERHRDDEALVIPVILRPCDWQEAPFGDLAALPKDGRPVTKFRNLDDAFLEVTRAIRALA